MRILFLQCHSGISGDMFLSSLLDAGLDEAAFREFLNSFGISREEVIISKVVKRGISSTTLRIEPAADRHHLHVEDIRNVMIRSGLKSGVLRKALETFERIVEAEAQVHGVSMEKVHLHEVSGLDTIVDILGVAWGLDMLQIDRVISTSINVGSGTVSFSHGVVPVPAPATALILKGIPVVSDDLPGERTTPTGAALAATFIDSFEPPGPLIPLQIGYGAGLRDDGDRANVLRAMICLSEESNRTEEVFEPLVMIETDIDDDTPEMLGYLAEKLMAMDGVLDVSVLATCRKKNRPGHLVRVLCLPGISNAARHCIFRESSTLGIRESAVMRYRQNRLNETVLTEWGPIRVTCTDTNIAPEYEDCRRYASDSNVPLRQVYATAIAKTREKRLLSTD